MIPTIQEPIECYLDNSARTARHPRLRWHPQSLLTMVEPPQLVKNVEHLSLTRKYARIRFKYFDGHTKTIKTKTVFFGDPQGQFVVDHDQNRRATRFQKLAHQSDPFHPNYWRLHILNNTTDMETNYLQFVKKVVAMRNTISLPKIVQKERKPRPEKERLPQPVAAHVIPVPK